MPKRKGILEAINAVEERQNFTPMNEFVCFLNENALHVGCGHVGLRNIALIIAFTGWGVFKNLYRSANSCTAIKSKIYTTSWGSSFIKLGE